MWYARGIKVPISLKTGTAAKEIVAVKDEYQESLLAPSLIIDPVETVVE